MEIQEKCANAYWCCDKCGKEYGSVSTADYVQTWHRGQCNVCGEIKEVTAVRHFNWLRKNPYEKINE